MRENLLEKVWTPLTIFGIEQYIIHGLVLKFDGNAKVERKKISVCFRNVQGELVWEKRRSIIEKFKERIILKRSTGKLL